MAATRASLPSTWGRILGRHRKSLFDAVLRYAVPWEFLQLAAHNVKIGANQAMRPAVGQENARTRATGILEEYTFSFHCGTLFRVEVAGMGAK